MQKNKGIVENALTQGPAKGRPEYACDAPFPEGKRGHLLGRFWLKICRFLIETLTVHYLIVR
jgi:hypothetical protein